MFLTQLYTQAMKFKLNFRNVFVDVLKTLSSLFRRYLQCFIYKRTKSQYFIWEVTKRVQFCINNNLLGSYLTQP